MNTAVCVLQDVTEFLTTGFCKRRAGLLNKVSIAISLQLLLTVFLKVVSVVMLYHQYQCCLHCVQRVSTIIHTRGSSSSCATLYSQCLSPATVLPHTLPTHSINSCCGYQYWVCFSLYRPSYPMYYAILCTVWWCTVLCAAGAAARAESYLGCRTCDSTEVD